MTSDPIEGQPIDEPPLWFDIAGPTAMPRATARPALLIHGSMDRSAGMLKLSRALDADRRLLRYDRRGYGRSVDADGRHPGPFTMGAQLADAHAMLDWLLDGDPSASALVIGHSYGGNVALALAAAQPQRVAAVVIYETPLSWEPWWPGSTAGGHAVATQGTADEAAERFMRRLIGDQRWESLPERTRATRRREGTAMVGELTDLRTGPPWLPEQIHCPVMAGFGSLGADHHQQGMRYVAEAIPTARAVELAGCRHDAPLSHPSLFRHMLIDPLEQP